MAVAARSLAESVTSRLRSAGFQSYLVGGCVRDLLLGIEPKDYDVVTDARPEQVLSLFPDARLVGAHFGVMLVREQDVEVEVATFRSEGLYADGRRPEQVQFETDPEKDARRRDFTINGLYMDAGTASVLDFVEGQEDLARRTVRAIGDPRIRFAEDHLRMLRAVRFAARLNFSLDEGTEEAIRSMAGHVLSVSAERVRDELTRILTEGNARYGFELLERTGLLPIVLPEIACMQGVEQPPEYHPEGDVWIHTLMMLEQLPAGVSPTLAWGVLLHDVGKPPTFQIADRIRFNGHAQVGSAMAVELAGRLRFSNEDRIQVEALVANHMRFGDASRMRESTLKRFLRMPDFDEHLELHRIDCVCSHGMLDQYRLVQRKREEFGAQQISPPRLLTGQDLIELGLTPGPVFGRLLDCVEDAQLEGKVQTKEEATNLAQRLLEELTTQVSE